MFDDQTLINPQKENCELINDADGFVVSVKDSSDNRFNERICPYCHSSLPLMYGKYPVKRIVLTGVTGSGKTVYLSSLLRNIQTYCANVNLSCSIQSPSVNKYVQNNIIEKGKPLPQATSPDQAIESLPITIKFIDDDGIPTRVTIVFYDVAGEEITSSLNNSTINPNYSRISGIAYENGYVRENSSKTDTLQSFPPNKGALLPWGSDNF